MSKKATEFQKKAMGAFYRGKEIFKPLNTGWIDENVACVRAYDESDDTEQNAKSGYLPAVVR